MGSDQSNSEMANDSIFTCHICTDEKPSNDLFEELGCDHFYCTDCIAKYICSRLEDRVATIKCPVPSCSETLNPERCRSILSKEVFNKWGDVLCDSLVLGFDKMYCPFKDCSGVLVDEKVVIFESECPYCNRLFCAQCQVPWHSGIVCAEFQKLNKDERSHEDILLMNLADREKWRRCSKCGFYVEKIDGCLFMKCRCGHTFCYNCGAPLNDHYCKACKR